MRTTWKMLGGAAIGVTLVVIACGGGGGGGGEGARTRFEGNVANAIAFEAPSVPQSRWAWLSPVGVAWAQVGGVEVCLQGSNPLVCTTTNEDGSFVLDAAAGDLVDPCLTFTATDFTGTVCIDGTIPAGSVVRIANIECSVTQGTCRADEVEVDEIDDVSGEDEPSVSVDDEVSVSDDEVSDVSDDSEDGVDDDNSGPSGNSGPGGGEDEPEDD